MGKLPSTLNRETLCKRMPTAVLPASNFGAATQAYGKGMRVQSKPPPKFTSGSKLKNTLVLEVDLAHLTEAHLQPMSTLLSRSLGSPCSLHLIKCARIDNVPCSYLIAVEALDSMIGVYEVVEYCGGVRCNRICDGVVRDLLSTFGSFPGMSSKYNPIQGNGFAGSPILPSGTHPDLLVGFC